MECDNDSVLPAEGSKEHVPPTLAHSETLAVKRSKRIVLAILIGAAVVVATLVYLLAANNEQERFKTDVLTFEHEITERTELVMRDYHGVLETLSTTMTSNAISGGQSWPNVSIPFFEVRANQAQVKSGMDIFMVAPLVQAVDRQGWEEYTATNRTWLRDGLIFQGLDDIDPGAISREIWSLKDDETKTVDNHHGPFAPVWQIGPAPTDAKMINFDLFSHKDIEAVINQVRKTGKAALSPILDVNFLIQYSNTELDEDRRRRTLERSHNLQTTVRQMEDEENEETGEDENGKQNEGEQDDDPRALIVHPVFSTFKEDAELVGFVIATFPWSRVFDNGSAIKDMDVVLSTSCGSKYTYRIDMYATLQGEGDLHQGRFDNMRRRRVFEPFLEEREELLHRTKGSDCQYSFDVYPTEELLYGENQYVTRYPLLYAFGVVFIFAGTSLAFVTYDYLVQRRQQTVMQSAVNANAILSSIFPATVQERMLKNAEEQAEKKSSATKQFGLFTLGNPKQFKRPFADEESEEGDEELLTAYTSNAIADLFTHATVIFADIAGFTAWSSVREASQVFMLLETVYAAFDKVAKSLKVFKVETVGDCYVAVAGLPVPRNDHATVMATFAVSCLRRFGDLTKKLEVILGPGTSSLGLRVGLHSGPVTAGVLRGDNARFQLFGDTVNVASRMETTGERNKIQVSNETATLLLQAGRRLTLRVDKVEAKGKGSLQTYWLDTSADIINVSTHDTVDTSTDDDTESRVTSRGGIEAVSLCRHMPTRDELDRLIDWNANNLMKLLTSLHAHRHTFPSIAQPTDVHLSEDQGVKMVLNEVKEIIELPKLGATSFQQEPRASQVQLQPEVYNEVRLYVKLLQQRYHPNPFHNFEHASHVCMSVVKLLSRIALSSESPDKKSESVRSKHHQDTYGITADPLISFACVFSALIHDVDHSGVSNAQLVAENGPLVRLYDGKSVAEQNSVDIAWQLLMEDRFANFRSAIFVNQEEFTRFRQILVNSVMATDIMDKGLKKLRDTRWDKAFQEEKLDEKIELGINRKATIVIEHLIQASDVAHTMQHWHVYRKWNEKLYLEMYQAYRNGRSNTDPTDGWYQGEIGFFDFYIIPLAKKLADCGVFGVSSFEYLNFAVRNRDEWISKGHGIVQDMRRMAEASELTNNFIEV